MTKERANGEGGCVKGLGVWWGRSREEGGSRRPIIERRKLRGMGGRSYSAEIRFVLCRGGVRNGETGAKYSEGKLSPTFAGGPTRDAGTDVRSLEETT